LPIFETIYSYILLRENSLKIIKIYKYYIRKMKPISEELYKKIVESSKNE